MPRPSSVTLLPDTVRKELGNRLIEQGFGGYDDLTSWLTERGFEISRSALGRWGADFKSKVETLRVVTEQCRVIVEESPDDEGAVNDALIRLTQQKIFEVLYDLNVEDIENVDLAKLAKSIADLGKASVAQKKWQTDMRARAQTAADEVVEMAKVGGLSDDVAAQIRAKILGVAG